MNFNLLKLLSSACCCEVAFTVIVKKKIFFTVIVNVFTVVVFGVFNFNFTVMVNVCFLYNDSECFYSDSKCVLS